MAYDAAELSVLSRLLDEALDVEQQALDGWLTARRTSHRTLEPVLRRMLEERRSPVSTRFLVARTHWRVRRDAADRPGACVGPYRLLRKLGRGGIGVVWLADRGPEDADPPVALKLPRRAASATIAGRMEREAQLGTRLDHPQLARQLATGRDAQGRRYIAFRHIDGQPLTAWVRERNLDIDARLRLYAGVLRAVAHIHARGIVHRDLKPDNILVTDDGTPHVIDFGIAMLAHDDVSADEALLRAMTPVYASPEQQRGEPTGFASDIYSLGVMLDELLRSAPAPDDPVPDALRQVVSVTCRPEPDRRYASCSAFAEALSRCTGR